ncbi:MAG: thiaminase II [Marinisporobacter sp.]|jgi:thiaminase/transcriptional activator TenA|nr:thiaminase II [Marinisporobacter sp.]
MSFSKRLIENERVKKYYEDYMKHPFIQDMKEGTLSRDKYRNYLIQDSLYLKDYAKVYASAFLLVNEVSDLQFLHTCIGVVVSDETNMHTKYLEDYDLDVYKVDHMKIKPANRNYLDYMLSFTKKEQPDFKEIFVSALPCTLVYEHIGKTLEKQCENLEDNYYGPWIKTYAGAEFEDFSVRSCEIIDRFCKDIDEEEEKKLTEIFIKACDYEMKFWDMSYE